MLVMRLPALCAIAPEHIALDINAAHASFFFMSPPIYFGLHINVFVSVLS